MKTFPIAEVFESVQGEGFFQGTCMLFIRTAGCNVGKYLHSGLVHSQCTSWDGRKFTCDTDYRKKFDLTEPEIEKLITETSALHVCVTGGEPFLHMELLSLIARIMDVNSKLLHIETSGTLDFREFNEFWSVWITVSPKKGCLSSSFINANEIKLVVDDEFKCESLPKEVLRHDNVYLQPIARLGESFPDANTRICLDLIKKHPKWRLSLQLQKILGVR